MLPPATLQLVKLVRKNPDLIFFQILLFPAGSFQLDEGPEYESPISAPQCPPPIISEPRLLESGGQRVGPGLLTLQ